MAHTLRQQRCEPNAEWQTPELAGGRLQSEGGLTRLKEALRATSAAKAVDYPPLLPNIQQAA